MDKKSASFNTILKYYTAKLSLIELFFISVFRGLLSVLNEYNSAKINNYRLEDMSMTQELRNEAVNKG